MPKQFSGLSSSMGIKEINATCDDTYILGLDYVTTHIGVNMVFSSSYTRLLGFGASFYVIPRTREWLTFMKSSHVGPKDVTSLEARTLLQLEGSVVIEHRRGLSEIA